MRTLGHLAIGLAVGLSASLALARAQAPAPASTSALPDIVGLRPGISLQEATRRLKAYNPNGTIRIGEVTVPEISSKPVPATLLFKSSSATVVEVPEVIELELTLPPERPIVWGIVRRVVFEKGKEKGRTTLVSEVRAKYGREGDGMTEPIVNIYWVYDEQGRRAETSDAATNHCARPGAWDIAPNPTGLRATSATFPAYSLLLGKPVPSKDGCKPLVHVKALFQPASAGGFLLVESTTIAVIDAALASRAQAATAAYRARPR